MATWQLSFDPQHMALGFYSRVLLIRETRYTVERMRKFSQEVLKAYFLRVAKLSFSWGCEDVALQD